MARAFEIVGNRLANGYAFGGLRAALAALDTGFASAATRPPKRGLGLNIEALAWDPIQSRLLLGFRSPLRRGKAVIVALANPDATLEGVAAPALSVVSTLDLGGEGVRDLTYDPILRTFLVLGGAAKKSKHGGPTLWRWDGGGDAPALLLAPTISELNAEGIAPVAFGKSRALLVVSDDGVFDEAFDRGRSLRDAGVPARYVLISYERLKRDNPALR